VIFVFCFAKPQKLYRRLADLCYFYNQTSNIKNPTSIKVLYSTEKSILQLIESEDLINRNIKLYIKRDDLIDSEVSGNKWRKLKYNIEQVKALKKEGIITFGGAFSNHLLATASACNRVGLSSVGIVRGNELNENSNETLRRCSELGMKLKFVSREEYRLKNDKMYQNELNYEFENHYVVPEGGANFYGMIGCQDILSEIDIKYDAILLSQGTTTTSCGILLSLADHASLHVVPALKGFDSLQEMRDLLNYSIFDEELTEELLQKVIVHSDYHFGGYGSYTDELILFIQQFYKENTIPLDQVYTGKALFALFTEIEKGIFDNKTIVFIHTGGIQGTKFIEQKEGISLFVASK
jgi:1-aminocyclopropane-1-carboxylate deaminase